MNSGMRSAVVGLVWVAVLTLEAPARSTVPPAEVRANDNRTPAGELRDGVLTVSLVAARGLWFPEADEGPAHEVHAFGTDPRALSNPGPLLRVPVGTEIRITIRNDIADGPLTVHGLRREPGAPDTLHIPIGAKREVRFQTPSPGTFFYWATTRGAATLRDRYGPDSQLNGVLIVDPPGGVPTDHVFVIGIEDGAGPVPAERPLHAAVVNGRSWPHSLSFTARAGDTVRMRWINATSRLHPMHLHGFYFRVNSKGDLSADTIYDAARERLAVTELMLPGQTMSLTWDADRPGNWLMHCHMAVHMSHELRRGSRPAREHGRLRNHTMDDMAGIVTGWRVLPRSKTTSVVERGAARRIRLFAQSAAGFYGTDPGLGFVVESDGAPPRPDSVVIPGPPLVLTRAEPVEITVMNRMNEATSIHWHGIELDSYFDGVSGWSGDENRMAPPVAPGDSFVVRFTPPRAGTFIYHAHFAEERQLGSGLYGPLIVLEPGATYDPRTDRSWILSQHGPGEQRPVMLNGSIEPVVELSPNTTHRIRLININPNVPLIFSVLQDSVAVRWRVVAKDGADLPPQQVRTQPAVQRIGVGETYDFELTPASAGELRLRAADPAGRVRLSGVVRIQELDHVTRIVRLLADQQAVFGIFSGEHAEAQGSVIVRNRDTDFVFYSLESGPFDIATMRLYMKGMGDSAGAAGRHPVALRIPPIRDGREAARDHVRQALEAGVNAIVFPHVESAEDAAFAIASMGADLWPANAHGRLAAMLIIEDRVGVENARQIARTPGVSVVFAGPGDLRRAYNGDAEAVERAIQTIHAACKEASVPCGITAGPGDIATRLEQGFRVIIVTDPAALPVGRRAAGRVTSGRAPQ